MRDAIIAEKDKQIANLTPLHQENAYFNGRLSKQATELADTFNKRMVNPLPYPPLARTPWQSETRLARVCHHAPKCSLPTRGAGPTTLSATSAQTVTLPVVLQLGFYFVSSSMENLGAQNASLFMANNAAVALWLLLLLSIF